MALPELNRICASSQQVVSVDNHDIRARNYIPVPNTTSPTFVNHFFGDTVSLFSIGQSMGYHQEPKILFTLFSHCAVPGLEMLRPWSVPGVLSGFSGKRGPR